VRAAVRTRRLSDDILRAFHHACDQGDLEVEERLLAVLESSLLDYVRRAVHTGAASNAGACATYSRAGATGRRFSFGWQPSTSARAVASLTCFPSAT
jgi:hypothetical protein